MKMKLLKILLLLLSKMAASLLEKQCYLAEPLKARDVNKEERFGYEVMHSGAKY